MRLYIVQLCCLLVMTPVKSLAQTHTSKETVSANYKNTMEFGVGTDHVSDGFGHWSYGRMKYTHAGKKLCWFLNTDYMYREKLGGFAFVPSAGIYCDCTKWFYVYSSISSATRSEYAPWIRGDVDLNFKVGKKKSLVLTLGGSGMDYYTEQSIWIAAAGMTWYHPGIILSGRFMYNICNPGTNGSCTYLFSMDQGYMGRYMNTLSVSYGNQSYLITSVDTPFHVERDAFSIYLRHRNWIRPEWGVQGQVGYSKVRDAYWTVGCYLGFFFHF